MATTAEVKKVVPVHEVLEEDDEFEVSLLSFGLVEAPRAFFPLYALEEAFCAKQQLAPHSPGFRTIKHARF